MLVIAFSLLFKDVVHFYRYMAMTVRSKQIKSLDVQSLQFTQITEAVPPLSLEQSFTWNVFGDHLISFTLSQHSNVKILVLYISIGRERYALIQILKLRKSSKKDAVFTFSIEY